MIFWLYRAYLVEGLIGRVIDHAFAGKSPSESSLKVRGAIHVIKMEKRTSEREVNFGWIVDNLRIGRS